MKERRLTFSRILWMFRPENRFHSTRRVCASTSGSWYSSIKTSNFYGVRNFAVLYATAAKFRSSSSVCGGTRTESSPRR